MVSADCSTKGSCISPLAKSSPTTFIPASRTSLTIASGSIPASASSSSEMSPSRSPSTMRWARRSETGHPLRSSITAADAVTPAKTSSMAVRGSYPASEPSPPSVPRLS